MTRNLMDKTLEQDVATVEELLSTATHMKEFGSLSNKMLRKLASHLPRASKMEANTLSMFSMVIHSDEM